MKPDPKILNLARKAVNAAHVQAHNITTDRKASVRKLAIKLLAKSLDDAIDLPEPLETIDGPVFQILAGLLIDELLNEGGS